MRKGITLIEILISTSILVLLAAILTPRFINFYERQNLKDDALKISFALKNARDKAMNREDDAAWGVRLANAGNGLDYFVIFSGPSFAGGQQKQTVTLNSNIQFVSPAEGLNTDVIFNKITGLPTAAANIIISLRDDSSASSTIAVSPSGEVRY